MMEDKGRPETDEEYKDRLQEQQDRASWQGRQVVEEQPPRAIIHEYPGPDVPSHVWRERKKSA